MTLKIVFIQNISFNDHRMVHTDGVARELIKRGHQVDVIIQQQNPDIDVNVPYNVIQVPGSTYSFIGQINFIARSSFILLRKKYDMIHAKNPFSSVLPALLCRNGAKIIYDMRGLWIDFGVHSGDIPRSAAPFLWKLDLWCMKKVDKIIAISHELKKELVMRGLEEDHINVVVGDGVAIEKIQNMEPKDIRDYLGIEGKVIGYVGSIARSRFSDKIIQAFKYVHDETDSVNLVMIGPCKEKQYFMELTNNAGLTKNVFFTGYFTHDDCLRTIKSFDVAISYHEGDYSFFNVAVPTKILEYCACGCPIVSTNHVMYSNLLSHNINGFLTNQNIESYAKGIIYVLENKKLLKKLSKNALIAGEQFSFEKIVNKIEKCYKIKDGFQ